MRNRKALLVTAALAALTFGTATADAPESAWQEKFEAGVKARKAGRAEEAETHLKAALTEAEKFGPDDLRLAKTLDELGWVESSGNKEEVGERTLRRALAIRERVQGPEHLDVAESLESLAQVAEQRKKFAEPEVYLKRAIAIREKLEGADHADVARTLHSLGGFYLTQNRFAEGETTLRKALEIRERALGPDHPDVANTLSALGGGYMVQKKTDEATPLLERALAVREKALGPNNHDTTESLKVLGMLYYNQGKRDEGRALLRRALERREKDVGVDHPDLIEILSTLAHLLAFESMAPKPLPHYGEEAESRDLAGNEEEEVEPEVEAESLLNRIIAIQEQAPNDDVTKRMMSFLELGLIQSGQGRWVEAEAAMKRGLAIAEKSPDMKADELREFRAMLPEVHVKAVRESKNAAKPQPTQADLDRLKVLSPSLKKFDLKRLARLGDLYMDLKTRDDDLLHTERLYNLTYLSLSFSEVTDAGLVHLEPLTELEELNLRETRITDAGLVHLEPLKDLKQLNLGGTQITDAGLIHLKSLKKLKKLVLDGTRVSEPAVNELRKALPDLDISIAIPEPTSSRFRRVESIPALPEALPWPEEELPEEAPSSALPPESEPSAPPEADLPR